MHADHRDALGLALALAAAGLAHRFVLGLELMGWDSWPTIAASRIASPADWWATFGEELMDGRYPGGRFYRPLVNLSFAGDFALWGLRPLGYQLTNWTIHLASVAAVFALARRWFGPGRAPWLAGLVFALHPLHLETVPVAARRADMLAALFTTAALLAAAPRAGPGRGAAGALCVAAAAACKETGAVALPVYFAALWAVAPAGPIAERTVRALRGAAPAFAAFALFGLLRTAALSGLGGHPGSSPLTGWWHGLAAAPAQLRSLVMPQPWTGSPRLDAGLGLALAGALLLGAVWSARVAARDDAARPGPGSAFAVLGLWVLGLLAVHGISGEVASWYGAPYLAPYALALGGLFAVAGRRRDAAAVLATGLVLILAASHLRYSSLVTRYPEWTRVSVEAADFLGRFRAGVTGAAPGTTISVEGLPLGTGAPLERVGVRSALCMSDYSVAAWSELALPERPVRVVLALSGTPSAPEPGVVTVDVAPLPSPVLAPGPPAAGPGEGPG